MADWLAMVVKLWLFFRHCLVITLSNWKRLVLSVLGVVCCISLFQVGMVVIQSYNHSIFKDYLDFDRNSILLNGEIPAELLTTIRMNSPESKITSYSGDIITQLGYSKNGHVNYFVNLIGTTADFCRCQYQTIAVRTISFVRDNTWS